MKHFQLRTFLDIYISKRKRTCVQIIQMEDHGCNTSTETLFFILYGVVGGITFISNIFTCVVFLKTEKLRRNKTNVLLVSLAVWDMLMSVLVAPFYAVYCGLGCKYSLNKYCWLMRGAKDCVKIATILNLYAITYDRYIAVLKPLQYNSKMTSKRVVAILAVVWFLPLILAAIRNCWQHNGYEPDVRFANKLYDSIIVLGFVFVLVIALLITNVKIMRAIRRQSQREKRDLHNSCAVLSPQRRKGTIACVTVVLVFVVCWLPRAVYNFSFIINPPGLASPLFFRICFLFLFLQSSLNPFIYWFYREEFRQAAFSLLKCPSVLERAESAGSALRTVSFLSETGQIQSTNTGTETFRRCPEERSEHSQTRPNTQLTLYKTSHV